MYMYSGAFFFNTLSGQQKQMKKSKSSPQLHSLTLGQPGGSAYARTKQWVLMAGPTDVFVLSLDGVLLGQDGSQATGKSFDGFIDALASTTYPFYIVSSQSTSNASDSVKRLKVEMPVGSPRLFAELADATKFTQALREIQKRPVCQDFGATMHFLAGSESVARAVAEADDLRRWKVYLADWSGVAAESLQSARVEMAPRIQVLRQKDLLELLKWGVLMGVDDGCEPEAEEVREGVMKDFRPKPSSLSEQSSD